MSGTGVGLPGAGGAGAGAGEGLGGAGAGLGGAGAVGGRDEEKRIAAETAAALVNDGMTVGLGTGSTVAFLLPALARRRLAITCVSTSPATEQAAGELGLDVRTFDELEHLDIAIDGADQVSPERWLVKGGGGAHTREKIVATAAARFVVIVSSDKLVDRVESPIPLELLAFGLRATLALIGQLGPCRVREVPPSPDGGVIADYLGSTDDLTQLAARLSEIPGVVGHGLFPPELVTEVIVGRSGDQGIESARVASAPDGAS